MASVRLIYKLALAQIFESPGGDEDFETYSPLLLNTLLEEALPYENMIRKSDGRPLLLELPEITVVDDTNIDMDGRICKIALPYGLASVLLADDESRKAESILKRNMFIEALESAAPAVDTDVRGWDD